MNSLEEIRQSSGDSSELNLKTKGDLINKSRESRTSKSTKLSKSSVVSDKKKRLKLQYGAHSERVGGVSSLSMKTPENPDELEQFNRMMEHFTAIQTSSATQSLVSESPDLRAIKKQMEFIKHQNDLLNRRMSAKFNRSSRSQSVKHHRHSKQFMLQQMASSQLTHTLQDIPAPRHSTGNIRDHRKRMQQLQSGGNVPPLPPSPDQNAQRESKRDSKRESIRESQRESKHTKDSRDRSTSRTDDRERGRNRNRDQDREHQRERQRDRQRDRDPKAVPMEMIKPSMRHKHTSTSTVPALPVINSTDIQIKVMRTDQEQDVHREKSPIPPIEEMVASQLRSRYTAGSGSFDSSFASSHSASSSSTSCSSSASSSSSSSCSSSGSSGSSSSSCSSSSASSSCSGSSGSSASGSSETTVSHSSDCSSQTETDLSHIPCSCRQSHFKRPKVTARNMTMTTTTGTMTETMASGSSSSAASSSSGASSETTAICTCDEDGSSCSSSSCDSETESESGSSSSDSASGSGSGSSGDDSDVTEQTMNSVTTKSKMYGTLPRSIKNGKLRSMKVRDGRNTRNGRNCRNTNHNHNMKSTTSNHLRTMVIHDNITADLFEEIEDDSTYTDPSIPCSGSSSEMVKGHNGKQDNRTMIVHGKGGAHRSRRHTTESELTATAAAGCQGPLLSPGKGHLGDHARYQTFVIHDDDDEDSDCAGHGDEY